jgi:hypothetical protein
MTLSALYETDIVAWADLQVAELRRLEEAGITNAVDWANVIEEIESVGERAADRQGRRPEVAPDIPCGVPPGLPARCPFTRDDLLSEAFTYETAVRRLYDDLKVLDESAQT